MYTGMQVFYAESLTTFVVDLNRCEPTLFLSVPRLWTKFQGGVLSKLPASKLDFMLKIPLINILIKKKVRTPSYCLCSLFLLFLSLTISFLSTYFSQLFCLSRSIFLIFVVYHFIYLKILKLLGLHKVRYAGSGSAPLPADVLSWYRRLGLELLEGYGMTENFNYSHTSMPGKGLPGYVGNTYDDVECRIAADGEIQVKTPGKMMGYFNNPEATAEAITEDGWVRTGDKGSLDATGRLKITGRTKEIFKTSKGKYVAPAPIENLLISNHLVELALVGGKSQPQPFALIQLLEGPKKKASTGASEREEIGKELEALLKGLNPKLDGHEHLAFLVVVKDDWLPENGYLTPTQKIKRNTIEDAYDSKVEGWYGEKKKVIFDGF